MSSRGRSPTVAAAFSSYVLLHLITPTRTPLARRDDDFFASMTDSLARHGTQHVLAEPITYLDPLILYGPVYSGLIAALGRLTTPGPRYLVVMGLRLVLRFF